MIGKAQARGRLLEGVIFLGCAFLFSLFTVFVQVKALGLSYLEEGGQIQRHVAVLQGTAGDPWQYRVLAEYLVEGVIRVFHRAGIPRPIASAFISFRVFQNVLIFLLAAIYYRKLGINTYTVLIGLSLLAWGMTHSLYDSDLQFNTYFDVIFYLLAGIFTLHGRYGLLIPLSGLAALNRETSGLIPFMPISVHVLSRPRNRYLLRKVAMISAAALLVYAGVFIGLRVFYGRRPLITPYGNSPGIELLRYNLGRYITWVQLFATLGLLPILALLSMPRWPRTLYAFFWAIVPIWFAVHLAASVMAETRLFLVPHALVFIPGALFGLMREGSDETAQGMSPG